MNLLYHVYCVILIGSFQLFPMLRVTVHTNHGHLFSIHGKIYSFLRATDTRFLTAENISRVSYFCLTNIFDRIVKHLLMKTFKTSSLHLINEH